MLSVLQFTDSDYPFGIFKFFLSIISVISGGTHDDVDMAFLFCEIECIQKLVKDKRNAEIMPLISLSVTSILMMFHQFIIQTLLYSIPVI